MRKEIPRAGKRVRDPPTPTIRIHKIPKLNNYNTERGLSTDDVRFLMYAVVNIIGE